MLEQFGPLNLWLSSRDLEAAKRFYTGALGLPLWREEPGQALHFGVGPLLLSIHAAADGDLPPRGTWIAFTVPSGIDRVCAELQRHGVTFEKPLADRPFGRSAMLRDPDGHELWVVEPSATETQFYQWRLAARANARRVPARRRPKTRRHEPREPSRRRSHPDA